jgi:hypothetical protein
VCVCVEIRKFQCFCSSFYVLTTEDERTLRNLSQKSKEMLR